MSTAGTTRACSGGHPASVIALRQSEVVAPVNWAVVAQPKIFPRKLRY